jgi:triosephosphate isomerase
MRKKLVAGNWKMNGARESNATLLALIASGLADVQCDVVVCPPFPYLAQVADLLEGSGIKLGAQTLSEHPAGAYTGEVSGVMLRECSCQYVLVGHSERRTLFGETDAVIAEKFAMAQSAGLRPVLCVGETLAQRESGDTFLVVAAQLAAVIDRVGVAALANSVVAYEPVWAIGTGRTASPAQAQEVHAAIRAQIAVLDVNVAAGLQILYGGSVKAQNAAELFGQMDIDGGLIGGAALVAEDFLAICRAAN